MMPAMLLLLLLPAVAFADECLDWRNMHPEWIWCDSFETGSIASDYDDVSTNNFGVVDEEAFDGRYSLRQHYDVGQVNAGWISWFYCDALGQNHGGCHDDIYMRWYHKFEDGFGGAPPKMARIRSLGPGWDKRFAVHFWLGGAPDYEIAADVYAPYSSQANSAGWLPLARSDFHYSEPENIGRWVCLEMRVKKNTPGSSDGAYQFWADNSMIVNRQNVDLVGSTSYNFNEAMLDCYWNGGSPEAQNRYYDNLVISTQRIGCMETQAESNILKNGGFEHGLQCFGNWVWPETGGDYQGDYDFFLSDDAHSGKFSLKIDCIGTNCEKAAVYTNDIYSPPGQEYRLSLWAKCAAGASAYIYLPYTQGQQIINLACTGSWTMAEHVFRAPSAGNTIRVHVYNNAKTPLYVDDIVLTYSDGSVPSGMVRHSGNRASTIGANSLIVDSKPYLALGFFGIPFSDLEQAAEIGANTVVALGSVAAYDCFNTAQGSYLDRAYELGINVAPDSTFTARLDQPAVFPGIMDEFSRHKAVIAWFLVDEPDQDAVSWYYIRPEMLIQHYTQAKTRTSLPIFSDMQQTWKNDVDLMRSYAPSMDFWMAEPYGTDFHDLASKVSVMLRAEQKPVWLAQDDIDASLIVPKAYWAVLSNATGIIYFTWGAFKADPAKLNAAGQAFSELGTLSPVLFAENFAVSGTGVPFIARSHNSSIYIIAVNPDPQARTATFSSPAFNSTVSVLFEGRTIAPSGGSFTDTFGPRTRHVYRISVGGEFCHEADNSPKDNIISNSELHTYLRLWHTTANVPLSSLLDAIGKWKNGC